MDTRQIRRLIEDELDSRTRLRMNLGKPDRLADGEIVGNYGRMPRDQALQELADDLSSGHGMPRLDFMAFADGDDTRLTEKEKQILTNALQAIRL